MRDKEGQYIMIKGTFHQEDITLINIYVSNTGAPKYIKQLLTDLKGEINRNTITAGDLNTPLTSMDRSSSVQSSLTAPPIFQGHWAWTPHKGMCLGLGPKLVTSALTLRHKLQKNMSCVMFLVWAGHPHGHLTRLLKHPIRENKKIKTSHLWEQG